QRALGNAPHIECFYGRQQELNEVRRWLLKDACQVIAILGIGGVGKTTLAAELVPQVGSTFQYIFWIFLQNAPLPANLLERCLVFFSEQQINREEREIWNKTWEEEKQLASLVEQLSMHRCLLVLDNFESVFQEGNLSQQYREEYKGYARLLQRLGEA